MVADAAAATARRADSDPRALKTTWCAPSADVAQGIAVSVNYFVARRFGTAGMGRSVVVGTADELAEHFAKLGARGVERHYVWFADFAPPETLRAFAEVITPSA